MDVKDIDLGWNKIVQKLQDLAKQEVDIGIQSGEMSEDGETDMATILPFMNLVQLFIVMPVLLPIIEKLKRMAALLKMADS